MIEAGGFYREPVTHSAPHDRYVGYRALWMKVIIRAAFDWVSYRDSDKLDKLKDAESGHNWIYGKGCLFNSFENICHMIDLPPEKIRAWAKKLTKDQVNKIEHLERDSSISPEALLRRAVVDDDE